MKYRMLARAMFQTGVAVNQNADMVNINMLNENIMSHQRAVATYTNESVRLINI